MNSIRKYLLHPITVYPQQNSKTIVRIAKAAGYGGLVVAPLSYFSINDLMALPPQFVASIENSWHPLTKANPFNKDAMLRVLGQRNADQAPLPWDNLFWGDRYDVDLKMFWIRRQFPHALFSGHTPENIDNWPGPYAWEINPDHGIFGDDVLKVPGKFSVDFLHLTRPERKLPHRQIVTDAEIAVFLRKLVKRRPKDIAVIHLHLSALGVIKFVRGIIPPQQRENFAIVADAGPTIPVAVQFMPPAPLNLFESTSTWLMNKIREHAQTMLFDGTVPLGFPIFA